jgi:hypothetical protein
MRDAHRAPLTRVSLTLMLMSVLGAIGPHMRVDAAGAAVTWIHQINVTVSGDVLQKTGGCDGCDDAGAISEQQIASGDGYVEFSIGETNKLFVAGLGFGDSGTAYSDIEFGFRFNGAGSADVLESGTYAGGDTPYAVGDTFRVAVVNGKVQYSRNGVVLLERAKSLTYPLVFDTSLLSIGATVRQATIASVVPSGSGGFLEKAGSQTYRSRSTATQIAAFLPPSGSKGKFRFPTPYNTQGVRLTNAADCMGGQDCLWYVGYSYWRNMNNHAGSDTIYILFGFDRNRGGAGPSVIAYNKTTDQVQNVGALFPLDSQYSYSTAEGWYFSATMPSRIYTFLPGGTTLRRYDVLTHQFESAPAMDLNQCPRPTICPTNAVFIYQPHSSDDDTAHSATVQDANFQRLGCVAFRAGGFVYVPTRIGYALDECHVDKNGQWLMMLEVRSSDDALDNRIIDLTTGAATTVADVEGGLGHLDMGFGYAVGADNYNPLANASILMKFPLTSTQRPVGPVVHYNKRWDIAAANHITHGNAVAGRSPEEQYACGSNASRVADMADEIICFSLNANRNTDGSLDVLVVAPVMTDLNASGGGGGDYEKMPKGNLDVTGRYFLWTTNLGGNRLDAFLVKVPADLLTATNYTPTAANKSATTAGGTPVTVTLSGTDVETCELAFSVATSPAHGSLSGISGMSCVSGSLNTDTAQITYTPNPGFAGTDSFTYRVGDGTASSVAATVNLTVQNSNTATHVGDLDGSGVSLGRGQWKASVTLLVHDAAHASLAGAAVTAVWSGGYSGTVSCTTSSSGTCTVASGNIQNSAQTATLAVQDIQAGSVPYSAAANHDPETDSDGTRIVVRKP